MRSWTGVLDPSVKIQRLFLNQCQGELKLFWQHMVAQHLRANPYVDFPLISHPSVPRFSSALIHLWEALLSIDLLCPVPWSAVTDTTDSPSPTNSDLLYLGKNFLLSDGRMTVRSSLKSQSRLFRSFSSFLSYFSHSCLSDNLSPFLLALATIHPDNISRRVLCQVIYLIKCDDMQMSWL